jgi:hypothetical protein
MSSTFHQAADLPWTTRHVRREFAKHRTLSKRPGHTPHPQNVKTRRAGDAKLKERRMPIISFREVIAAWALLVVVGGFLFGADLVLRDSSTACQQRVVAPQRPVPGAGDIHDRGERLERLDWDKDINASGAPAPAGVANPCPL